MVKTRTKERGQSQTQEMGETVPVTHGICLFGCVMDGFDLVGVPQGRAYCGKIVSKLFFRASPTTPARPERGAQSHGVVTPTAPSILQGQSPPPRGQLLLGARMRS